MKHFLFITVCIITSPFVAAQDLGDPECDSLLLVSSWRSNNVKIFDGCDGKFIKDMAETGVLEGPQAIFQDDNGDIIVVSESNHKLVKFDQLTLSIATTVVAPGLIQNPITVVKKNSSSIYLGSYSSNQIIELDTHTWQPKGTILPANNGQIEGIDIGMAMGPDGYLYVPGFDSNNILKVNPLDGSTNQFVPSGAEGLKRPRTILFSNDKIFATAWGNQALVEYSPEGQILAIPINGFKGITGMVQDGPGHVLVTSDSLNTVRRYQLNDFSFETLITTDSGGLTGATYVYRLSKINQSEDVTGMRQAWVTGLGAVQNKQIIVSDFHVTQGGAFGTNFDPETIESKPWGNFVLEYSDCHSADMSYQSKLTVDGKEFGSGGYPITRIAMNPSARACQQIGFDHIADNIWMNGTFYGGEDFDGEGFTVDLLEDNRAVVTWYTYLPKAE